MRRVAMACALLISGLVATATPALAGGCTRHWDPEIDKYVYNGTSGADNCSGTSGPDVFFMAGGNDTVNGGGGGDTIRGQGGNDTLRGGTGNDFIFGGLGDDYADGDDGNDNITMSDRSSYEGPYREEAHGGNGNDRISTAGGLAGWGGYGNDYFDLSEGGNTGRRIHDPLRRTWD